jgi:hypothetical protein
VYLKRDEVSIRIEVRGLMPLDKGSRKRIFELTIEGNA